jgi:KaiC/GvpD/RAD55 family RecA-like ATPase
MDIRWDKQYIPLTPEQVVTALREGKPAIVVGTDEPPEVLRLNSSMLQPEEERIIADTLVAYLKTHSS